MSCSFLLGTAAVMADLHMESSDKANEGLLYHATFDNTLKPARSAGSGELSAFGPAAKRFGTGVMNQGLRIGVNGSDKFYAVLPPAGIIDHKQGSISFWFKPENWAGSCKDFNIFVSGSQKNNHFYIYKYGAPTFGFCTIAAGKATFRPVTSASWKTGEWHHITVVWNKDYQRLYLDSKPVMTAARSLAAEPFTVLYLGSRLWAVEKGTSILDELKIFNRPLSDDEVSAEYSRFGKKDAATASNGAFTVGKKSVKVDGVIAPEEYDFQSTGFVNIPDGYASEQTSYAISHDDQYIYVAIQAHMPRQIICNISARDGSVWTDDSVEIWLANARDKKPHQFVFNTKGVLYDAMPLEKTGANWNVKNYRSAATVKDKIWTLEAAIAKSELGGGNDFLLNLGRTTFVGDTPVPTSLMPVRKHLGYSDVENYARLALKDSAPVFRLKKLGDINSGKLDLEIETSQKVSVSNDTNALAKYKEDFVPQNGKVATKQLIAPGGKLTVAVPGVFTRIFTTRNPSPVAVQYIYVEPTKNKLLIALKNEGGENGGKLSLQLKKRSDQTVVISKNAAVSGSNFFWEESLPVNKLEPGDYDFEAVYTDPSGKKSETFVQFFRKPGANPVWQNHTIGIYENEVPPPWSNLQVDGQNIKTMLQEYQWQNSLFPVRMLVKNRNILAAPMELVINGKVVKNARVQCVEKQADKVVFVTTGTLNQLKVTCHITVEFDGFMWVKMTLEGRNVPVKSMICNIPMQKEIATQVHACEVDKHVGNPPVGYTGLLKKTNWQKNLYNKSAFWIGNDDAGLAWFAENLVNWVNSDRNRSAEIIPGAANTLVKLTMLDKNIRINGKRNYEFGLQMTPVKTYDPTPRTARLGVDWGWGTPVKYFDYNDPGEEFFDQVSHDQRRKGLQARGGRYFLYIASNGAGPYWPEWPWYAENWTSNKIGDYYIELQLKDVAARNRNVWTYACLNSKSFRDFKIYQTANVANSPAWDVRNIYYDLVGPRLCANTNHGCGWKDDSGNLRATFTIRGCRDFHKRIYSLMKKLRPDSMHYYHVTGQPALPAVSSFCHALVEGESFFNNHLPEKETYFGAVDPGSFRVAYSAQKWGYQLIFIPQLERAAMFLRPERRKLWNMAQPPEPMDRANRHIAGYFYTNDIMVWGGGFSFYKLYDKAWKKQQQFFQPWDNKVKFIGYWEKNKPFTAQTANPDRVMVSAYVKGPKAMIAIANDTDSPQKVKVSYPGKKSASSFTGQAVNIKDGKFTVELKPQVFELVYLQ